MTAKELIHYLLNFDMNSEVTFIDENNVENHITSCSRDWLGMGKFINNGRVRFMAAGKYKEQ